MKKRLWIFFLLFITAHIFSIELSEEEAVSKAVTENLSLKMEGIKLRTKTRNKNNWWNEFLPNASTTANFWESDQYVDLEKDPWNLTASVNLNLGLSGATGARIHETKLYYETGKISFEMAQKSLERDVRIQFKSILIAKEKINIYKQIVETAKDNYERAKLNFELGSIPKVDVLSYQVKYESLKPDLISIENYYETSLLELKRILALPLESELSLEGTVDFTGESIEEIDSFIQRGLNQNLELRELNSQIERLKVSYRKQNYSIYTPSFGIGYRYSPNLNAPGSANWTEDWDDSSSRLDIFFTLPLDGFVPNSKKSLDSKTIKDEIESLELRQEDGFQRVHKGIKQLILDINKSVKTISVLDLNIQLAKENYAIIDKAYFEGAADYIDVKTAQDQLNVATINKSDEVLIYWSNLLQLEYIINGKIESFQGEN